MVKEELEKWDEPISVTPSAGNYASRAASPSSYSPALLNILAIILLAQKILERNLLTIFY
jgi:hypothetical protein